LTWDEPSGLGEVFLARDTRLERDVALNLLRRGRRALAALTGDGVNER
jgi:hypothetical protein